MDKFVVHILKGKFFRGRSDVAFVVPIGSEPTVGPGHQHENSDIELPALVKQWAFDVFLNNERFFLVGGPIGVDPDLVFDFRHFVHDNNPLAAVGVLSGFQDPQISERVTGFLLGAF